MKKIKLIIFSLFLFIPSVVLGKELNIYLFYGDGCPHCENLQTYLDSYLEEKDNIHLYRYEVWNNKNNKNKLKAIAKITNVSPNGIPYLIIGDDVITGFNSRTSNTIEKRINYCLENDCPDVVGRYLGVGNNNNSSNTNDDYEKTFNVPILGEIKASEVSIPLLAIVIGVVDGFNPCAMWILIFLISMLFNLKDKKKMWILGLTFIITSGLVYLLFMVSWLNLATFLNEILLVRTLIAVFAVIFGLYNIYNYIKSLKNDDGCVVTNKEERKKIMSYIKKVVIDNSFLLSIIGIMALAFGVNLIELFCSLGLPVIFTQVLSLNNLTSVEYIIYMLIYIVFFLIDDIIIFVIAMKTLEIKAISNKYTKYSHLIGGLIMIIIGMLLILKPEWIMFNF